jgi:hypothetical protein
VPSLPLAVMAVILSGHSAMLDGAYPLMIKFKSNRPSRTPKIERYSSSIPLRTTPVGLIFEQDFF